MTATAKPLSRRDKVWILCTIDGKLAKCKGDVVSVSEDGLTCDVNVHETYIVANDDGSGTPVQDHRVVGGKSGVKIASAESTEENTCWPRSGRWGASREGGRLWIPEE